MQDVAQLVLAHGAVSLPLGDGQRVLAPLSHPRVASEVLLRVRARARVRVRARARVRARGRARARARVRVASTLLDAQAQLRLLVEKAWLGLGLG